MGYAPSHGEQVFDVMLGLPEELIAQETSDELAGFLAVMFRVLKR